MNKQEEKENEELTLQIKNIVNNVQRKEEENDAAVKLQSLHRKRVSQQLVHEMKAKEQKEEE